MATLRKQMARVSVFSASSCCLTYPVLTVILVRQMRTLLAFLVMAASPLTLHGFSMQSSMARRLGPVSVNMCDGKSRQSQPMAIPQMLLDRRQALVLAAAAAAGTAVSPSPCSAEGARYADDARGFEFQVPQGWIQGEAEFPGGNRNPSRPKIISFRSPTSDDFNIALVSYSIQPDYSKLGSFGTIEDVAKNIIGTNEKASTIGEILAQKQTNLGGGPGYIFNYRINDKRLATIFTTSVVDLTCCLLLAT